MSKLASTFEEGKWKLKSSLPMAVLSRLWKNERRNYQIHWALGLDKEIPVTFKPITQIHQQNVTKKMRYKDVECWGDSGFWKCIKVAFNNVIAILYKVFLFLINTLK